MKTLKIILFIILALVVILCLAGLIFLNNLKKGAIPDYNKNEQVSGLKEEVTIYRDTFGIPHIIAKNESDLYRATGYVMAQDRLWQMDFLRHVSQGRLSEIFGKDMVESDLLLRSLRIPEKSVKILAISNSEVAESLEALADGINQYIKNHKLPPEFRILGYKPEPWEPEHSINLIGYMSWDLTSGWGSEMLLYQLQQVINKDQLNDLIPDTSIYTTPVFTDFTSSGKEVAEILQGVSEKLAGVGAEIFSGSNNWAVSPKKSKTGSSFLASDAHLGFAAPGIWTQIHQVIEGKLNVTGVFLPGSPYASNGHNDSIAWGMTNVSVDDIDFYRETINNDSTKYFFNHEWHSLTIKEEVIRIKGGEEKKFRLLFTHRGPIINQFRKIKGEPISFRWIGNEMSNEGLALYKLNRAKNWEEFLDAVKDFKSVSQNIAYADQKGNIGLQTCAGVPIREGDGITIYPGDTSKYDWKGLVPFEELPFEFNPARGYVSSANNKTVPNSYPYYISHWFAKPYRIDRIRKMLEEKEKLGTEDFQAMQADSKSKLVEWILPFLLNSLKETKQYNEIQMSARQKLQLWDGKLSATGCEAAIFEILYRRVLENLIRDDLPKDLFEKLMGNRLMLDDLIMNILPEMTSLWIDDKTTAEKESFDDIVMRSFTETVNELTGLQGADPEKWEWGKLHTLTLNHPMGSVKMLDKVLKLNRGPFEVQGGKHTVCPYAYNYNNLYKVNHGASQRHIFDLSNWDASKTVIPTGVSGIPASPYYCNQTSLYIQNKYHADPFSLDEVKKAARFEMKLIP